MGLFDIFSGRRGRQAAMAQVGALEAGKKDAYGAIDTGLDRADSGLREASATFRPLTDLGKRGAGLHADAMGVNGAEGQARAGEAFRAGPGFGFAMDQGLKALMRRRNAGGMLNSGNADVDAMAFAEGLASQEYKDWRSALNPYFGLVTVGTAGEATPLSDLAKLGFAGGVAKAGVATQTAQGVGNASAAGMRAGDQAAANGFNALLAGLQLGANVLGGGMGGMGGIGGGAASGAANVSGGASQSLGGLSSIARLFGG